MTERRADVTAAPARCLRVGDRLVGPGEPVFVIAEIGVNHQGRIDVARDLIDAAAAAGADAVKFQKRSLSDLYDRDLLANPSLGEQKFQYLLPLLEEFELTIDQLRDLRDYARGRGLVFFATPFDAPSADALETLDPPVYKIGSPDLTNVPLLEHVASFGKPMIVSTGMAEETEIDEAARLLQRLHVDFALLHANSTYPAPPEEINLRFMDRLGRHGAPVGYSGHERGIAVSMAAVARGASLIERHLTLDREQEGPDHQASLLPEEFAALVAGIRQVELALGTGRRRMTRIEVMNREALGKCVVAARPIRRGERITRDMLEVRSPAKGLSPQRIENLVGMSARRDFETGDRFLDSDLAVHAPRRAFDPRGLGFRWAPVVRFPDVATFLPYRPPAFEFHLASGDLDETFDAGPFGQELIVHAPEYMNRTLMDLASPDAALRRRSADFLRRTIDKVHELAPLFQGVPKLVVHPGGYSQMPSQDPERFRDLLSRSMARIDMDGLELLLENLPPRPWFFGGAWAGNLFLAGDEIRGFLQAHDLKLCLDTSHAQLACNAAGTSLLAFCRTLKPFVRHLHLSDGRGIGDEGLQIGEGDVDWAGVSEIFRDYDGTITPEIWQGHLEGGKGFLVALERLAPLFDRSQATVRASVA